MVTKAAAAGSLCVRAQVFRVGGARGWGLRARQRVPRGAPVALYCGELLPLPQADTRPADHYMFALDVKPDLLEVKEYLCVANNNVHAHLASFRYCGNFFHKTMLYD